VNDKKRDKMYLVRKKTPGKSAFFVTSWTIPDISLHA